MSSIFKKVSAHLAINVGLAIISLTIMGFGIFGESSLTGLGFVLFVTSLVTGLSCFAELTPMAVPVVGAEEKRSKAVRNREEYLYLHPRALHSK